MRIIVFMTGALLVALSAAGCEARHIYEGLRTGQELECQKLERADQTECLRRSGMNYDEYQRHLKERSK